ncbi:MAG: type II toxin-antitoxin system mRNA interferase toxin, RelE/StbE family [Candidatus Brocadiaceae bacterium]|nr:type II toxin-antitoxin system mRNA interferase toxin, RelE/StbE family [Candidatus Brocadiaceae bacterium]
MKRIESPKSFRKTLKKLFAKNPELRNTFKEVLDTLTENPFTPSLKTHKLKGRLKGFLACTITPEIRLIFQIEAGVIILIDIGSHNEVY